MLLKNIFSIHTNIVPSGTVNIRCPRCGQRGQMSVFHAQRDAAVYGLRFLRRDGRRFLVCSAAPSGPFGRRFYMFSSFCQESISPSHTRRICVAAAQSASERAKSVSRAPGISPSG